MQAAILGVLASVCYLGAAAQTAREILAGPPARYLTSCLAWLGLALHGAYLTLIFLRLGDLNFGFFNAAALVTWVIVLILQCAAVDKPVEKLGAAVFPLAALALAMDIGFPARPHVLSMHNWQMNLHVLSSIIAFSLLNLAALQAMLLIMQDKQLRGHKPRRLALALPPLQAMETLLFQLIGVGLLFLSGSLVSGFLFIDDLFAQHLVHKTVLSITAWLIFGGLLLGRWRYGWRGAAAIRWTLLGFAALALAYFGSKLVLELILKRV